MGLGQIYLATGGTREDFAQLWEERLREETRIKVMDGEIVREPKLQFCAPLDWHQWLKCLNIVLLWRGVRSPAEWDNSCYAVVYAVVLFGETSTEASVCLDRPRIACTTPLRTARHAVNIPSL